MQLKLLYRYRHENTQNRDNDNKFKESKTLVRRYSFEMPDLHSYGVVTYGILGAK